MTAAPALTEATLTDLLWDALVEGDEYTAGDVVAAALECGLDTETVLLDVIGAVQRRVGAEWAAARITVAQEHAATAINERVIATLRGRADRPTGAPGRITVACVDGEWHALPARLLAETLTLRGFRVDYLGAQVPTPHLVAHLHRTAPDAVALSSSIPTRLPTAHATITACQAAGVPVIVGGAAFGADGRYADLLGAQAWAPDARAAADRLLGSALVAPTDPHQPIDDLPHLPTRSTPWSRDRRRGWWRRCARPCPSDSSRCAPTPTSSTSTRPRTSRTWSTSWRPRCTWATWSCSRAS